MQFLVKSKSRKLEKLIMTEIPLIESNLFNFFEIKKQYKSAKF